MANLLLHSTKRVVQFNSTFSILSLSLSLLNMIRLNNLLDSSLRNWASEMNDNKREQSFFLSISISKRLLKNLRSRQAKFHLLLCSRSGSRQAGRQAISACEVEQNSWDRVWSGLVWSGLVWLDGIRGERRGRRWKRKWRQRRVLEHTVHLLDNTHSSITNLPGSESFGHESKFRLEQLSFKVTFGSLLFLSADSDSYSELRLRFGYFFPIQQQHFNELLWI